MSQLELKLKGCVFFSKTITKTKKCFHVTTTKTKTTERK